MPETLTETEAFLLSLYRFAVFAVRTEQEIQRAADVWRETLDVIDSTVTRVQALVGHNPGIHASVDRILEIRRAASETFALYQ